MNIELNIDGVTLHVQFQNATGVGCLLSDTRIPGSGYGRPREVTRQQLQLIAYGYRSVERGDQADLLDASANAVSERAPLNEGDVLTTTKDTRNVRA